jgi:hypothetical protein
LELVFFALPALIVAKQSFQNPRDGLNLLPLSDNPGYYFFTSIFLPVVLAIVYLRLA